jgi:hypothetical protein
MGRRKTTTVESTSPDRRFTLLRLSLPLAPAEASAAAARFMSDKMSTADGAPVLFLVLFRIDPRTPSELAELELLCALLSRDGRPIQKSVHVASHDQPSPANSF